MRMIQLIWVVVQVVLGTILTHEIGDFLKSDFGPFEQIFGIIYLFFHLLILAGIRVWFHWWFFRGLYLVGVAYTVYFFQGFYPTMMLLVWMGWFLIFFLGLHFLWWRSWSASAFVTFAFELIAFEAIVIWVMVF